MCLEPVAFLKKSTDILRHFKPLAILRLQNRMFWPNATEIVYDGKIKVGAFLSISVLVTQKTEMVDVVNDAMDDAYDSGDHKVLYELHNENEGGVNYFRTVCRNFYRFTLA